MKNLKQSIAFAFLIAAVASTTAQTKNKVKEEGEIKVIMINDNNGELTKINKSFSLDDKNKVEELLKENGIELNLEDLKGGNSFKIDQSTQGKNQDVVVKVLKEEEIDGEVEKDVQVFNFTSSHSNAEVDDELVKEIKKAAENGDVKKIMELTGKGEHEMIFLNADEGISHPTEGKVIVKTFITDDEDVDSSSERKIVINKTYKFNSNDEGGSSGTMIFFRKESKLSFDDKMPTKIEESFDKGSNIEELKLFPNPTNYNFNMSFTSKEPMNYNLSITDAKGSIVFEKELINFEGSFNEDFDLSKHENGIYFFNLLSDNEKISKQIIVQ